MAGTTVGEVNVALEFDPSGATKGLKTFEKQVDNLDNTGKKTNEGFTVFKGTLANLASAGVQRALGAVTGSLESGIKRIDTLKNADVVFKAMGYATEDVNASMSDLKQYLDGLPTSLDEAVTNVQSLSASFGGIENGTRVFKAMNDAGLAFGESSAGISEAVRQLSQLPMDGPLDAQTWNSLRQHGFTPVFAALADEAGVSMGELKEQFGSGELTVQDFTDMLVKMDTEGTSSMESLADMARANTNGIGTAIENVRNRLAKAWEKIIDTIGREDIANAINAISSRFEEFAGAFAQNVIVPIVDGLKQIDWAPIMDALGKIMSTVGQLVPVLVQALVPVLQAVFQVLGQILPILADIFATAAPMLSSIVSFLAPILAGIMQIAGFLVSLLKPAIDIVKAAFDFAIQPILFAASQIYAQFIAPAINYFNQFKDNAKAAIDIIAGSIGALPSRVLSFIDQVRAFFVDKFNAAKNAAKSAVDSIVSFVTGIPGRVGGKINEIKTKFTDAINGAKDTIKSAVDAIVEFITGIPGRIGDIGGKIADKITSGVSGAVSSAQDAIGGVLSAVGLASGGYVKATPGGTLAVIGEGGEDEFVIPRSQMIDLLTGVSTAPIDDELPVDEVRTGGGVIVNNHFTINSEMDAEDIGRRINNSIRRATI